MLLGIYCVITVFILKGVLGQGIVKSDGQSHSRISKIVNGNAAPRGKYPSQALIFRTGYFVCGGTILGQKHILTASHCLRDLQDPRKYRVKVGKHMMYSNTGSDQNLGVDSLYMHDAYDEKTNANDIAVIKLKANIEYNEYVQPVTLADTSSTVNRRCYASGFGVVRQTPDYLARTLQEIKSRVIDKSRCIRIATKYKVTEYINQKVLCTRDSRAGACAGDSGGPIGCFIDGNYTQFGVLSFGSTECTKGFNVYVRVSEYRDWIGSIINS